MDTEKKEIPDILKMSVYTSFNLKDYSYEQIIQILTFFDNEINNYSTSSIDCFCVQCQKHTTFKSRNSQSDILEEIYLKKQACEEYNNFNEEWVFNYSSFFSMLNEIEHFTRSFYCPRAPKEKSHDVTIILRVNDDKITKIGQFPQIADLENSHLKKYKDLDVEIYKELNRALGLNSHGIGVGSFVYLRRIIEKYIVFPEIQQLVKEEALTAEQIGSLDFKRKVILAKDRLPKVLVENTKVYSVLSKGIHSLTEEECLEIFNPILMAIELILDERLEKIERDRKLEKMNKDLNKI